MNAEAKQQRIVYLLNLAILMRRIGCVKEAEQAEAEAEKLSAEIQRSSDVPF